MSASTDFDSHPSLVSKKIRRGTRNMAIGPAMTKSEMNAAIAVGRTLAQQARIQNRDLIAVGEMGIGNTTSAAAITAALSAKPVAEGARSGSELSAASRT